MFLTVISFHDSFPPHLVHRFRSAARSLSLSPSSFFSSPHSIPPSSSSSSCHWQLWIKALWELRRCQPGKKHCHEGPGQQALLLSNTPPPSPTPWELDWSGGGHWSLLAGCSSYVMLLLECSDRGAVKRCFVKLLLSTKKLLSFNPVKDPTISLDVSGGNNHFNDLLLPGSTFKLKFTVKCGHFSESLQDLKRGEGAVVTDCERHWVSLVLQS